MQIRVETIAEMKRLKLDRFATVVCIETEKEYYLEPNGGSITPDDDDYVQAPHGPEYRYISMEARGTGGGGGGGGGGGSAYPDTVTIVSTNKTLALSEQGIVVLVGGVATLPASAPDGTTFKFVGSPNDMNINSGAAPVIRYGTGAIRLAGASVMLVAVNSPSLMWYPINLPPSSTWYANTGYPEGALAHPSGQPKHAHLAIQDNFNQPLTNDSVWLPLYAQDTGVIEYDDLTFDSVTPPTGVDVGSYTIYKFGGMRMLSIYLHFTGTSDATTRIEIGATKTAEIASKLAGFEADVPGFGYIHSNPGIGAARALEPAIYSPVTLGIIYAMFAATTQVRAMNIRFFLGAV